MIRLFTAVGLNFKCDIILYYRLVVNSFATVSTQASQKWCFTKKKKISLKKVLALHKILSMRSPLSSKAPVKKFFYVKICKTRTFCMVSCLALRTRSRFETKRARLNKTSVTLCVSFTPFSNKYGESETEDPTAV